MTSSRTYQGILSSSNGQRSVEDELVIELPLQININDESWSMTMQTPGDELNLVRGLLYSEDIFRSKSSEPQMVLSHSEIDSKVDVSIPVHQLGKGYANSRQLLSVASCGICGRVELKALEGKRFETIGIDESILLQLIPTMRANQALFERTGGCHGIGAFSKEGNLLVVKEDIGRHNAVDKVIGHLLCNGQLDKVRYLSISGRISYEIVAKAFMAGIATLVSVSSPSSLAVDLAKEFGMRLIAFCREDRYTIYA